MKTIILLVLALLTPLKASGHMEDRPGPHGGQIKMPGAFHTELKIVKNEIKLWLLDIDLKNPETANSSVEIEITEKDGKTHRPKCTPKEDYFTCGAKILKNRIKSISVISKRNNMNGVSMEYNLIDVNGKRNGS